MRSSRAPSSVSSSIACPLLETRVLTTERPGNGAVRTSNFGSCGLRPRLTTGAIWKFLTLTESQIAFDLTEYGIGRLDKLLGILQHIVESAKS